MKHVFLLLTAIILSAFSLKAQSIQEINRTLTNDRAGVNTLRDNLNSRGGGQASCGPDTVLYSLAKATGLQIVNVNNATSVFAVSQYYDAPQDITINGASFYAFKADATGGIATDVAVSVYVAGPDSLPTGAPLTTAIVSVDTTFGTGALTTLVEHANFNPITVSQPYCVVVENNSPNGIGIVTSNYTAADGQGEWLGSGNLFGTWLHGYDLVLGPDQFDADILIEPHVEYLLEADFTQTGVCIQGNGGDGTWVNNSSPILGNRMYSFAAFLGQTEAQYSWAYGDGSPIENITDGAHTYTGTSPWTVTLTDTLFGWSIICVDDFIENAETVEAGTLTANADPVCLDQGTADISATEGDAPVVPAGYSVLYVLTDADNNLTVIDAAATPNFTVTTGGNYIIHTLVYDPNTLDPATAIGLEALVVNGLLVQGGGSICAALDLVGSPISVEAPGAGTLTADASPVCIGGTMSATEADAPVVPAGYSVLYVLTDADNNLTVVDAATNPSFPATTSGNFIIHTLVYDPNTLDPTTAIGLEALVVNGLLVQGGGTICAALDLVGAPILVEGPEAGTLTANADPVCLDQGTADISATEGDAPVVPGGYSVLYVLTDADNNLTVVDAAATPDFTVNAGGNYIIHTLVYDPNTLDPTTAIGLEALAVNGLLVQGGGSICAALDLVGAPISVEAPEAGTLIADASPVCIGGTMSATEADAPVVPAGYSVLYVLTDADNNLTVVDAAATPSFPATTAGNFIIHTLVYDPNTLDPTTAIGLEALVVNGLLVQGGGTICAALDLVGAPVTVEGPEAGTLTADVSPVCLFNISAVISATEADAPVVPTGYEVLYVLTDADNNLTVVDAAATPEFTVTSAGNYIIHTLVYDPNTLDPTTAVGLEALVVNGLLVQGGGTICAALDLVGAPIEVESCSCDAEAGTLTADASPVCIGGIMSATEGDAPVVPTGYEVLYVLTDADNNLTVVDAAATPSFPATTAGNFIIHTLVYDPTTLDPTTAIGLEAGVVNGLLVQGGGSICAALDLVGAPIEVGGPEAGTLTADASPVCVGGTMSATESVAPVVPTGYQVLYVLTDADNNLTVIDAAATPSFSATAAGNFIIHTLVYDPNTLDPTTAIGLEALVVNGLLVQGGGSICAALDLVGAPILVEGPEAGTLTADASPVCVGGTMSATEADAPVVPAGYSVLYVLTDADNNLTVVDAAATPSFTATTAGNFIIHTLVYDPNTLDPATAIGLEAGVVNGLLVQGGGSICAALDLVGAPIEVEGPEAGTLTPDVSPICFSGGSVDISATEGTAPVVPTGYSVLYVLTDADNNLTIVDAAATPEFAVTSAGNYIIHTLVYDPNTLDPTTAIGLEALVVNGLLVQGGGTICAALDLVGAPIAVEGPEAGTLTADASPVCLFNTSTVISATEGDAPVVPTGYEVLYVLTDADNNLTVLDASATAEFTVTSDGNYIIHTLVYDPNTLDPATAIGLEAAVVNGLLVQGGGSICAALDLVGAPITVEDCSCDAEAGTLTADASPVCVGGTMSATEGDAPVIPTGYEVLYVLTDADNNLTVVDAAATPSFAATTAGNFIIHTLVYDPATLDPATAIGLEAGVVNGLLLQGGGTICAALDLVGASITVEGPEAGTLIADASPVCVGGTMSATAGDAPVVPAGYEVLYVLTDADNNLTVVDAAASPSFAATTSGNFIIHTLVYDPITLDPTTAIGLEALVVNGLLVQGGGSICAALDLVGAPITVEGPEAGTLVADASPVCVGGTMSATEGTAPVVPAGYEVLYVLTDADNNLTILDASATPSFSATAAGNFIIHTLVYDPTTLDPTIAIGLEALAVNGLLVQGGGTFCAALDLVGAPITVVGPEAGTLNIVASPLCVGQTIEATVGVAPVVPAGYEVLYVLTDADNNLTVVDASATPSFAATAEGNFIVHTLVYDPNTLDPATAIGLEAGVVNGLLVQGGGSICAALDLVGAPVTVEDCPCDAEAGTLTADASSVCVSGVMTASVGTAPVVPAGYEVLYVLTDADNNLTVLDASATPSFPATTPGNYIIHTLVYDPNTLDPATAIGLEAGVVNGLLLQGGGSICAALDLVGAPIAVVGPQAGTLTADISVVCLENGSADISASENVAPEVPAGYAVFYVLTDADNNLTVLNASPSPIFTVSGGGNYIIHTLVYNPDELDPGTTIGLEAAAVNGLLVQGGGSICAALDLVGAAITIEGPEAGSLTADAEIVCLENGSADISATEDDAPVVPAGYLVLYVLTDADNNLTVLDAAATPEFTITTEGNYIIHTLVYDPNTLTPTTAIGLPALDVNALLVQGGGSICAALDLTGAPITVSSCTGIQETLEANFNVYPNPSNGDFVLEVAGVEDDAQVTVLDATGRLVYSETVNMTTSFRKEFNLNVAKGTYLLQLTAQEALIVRKIQIN